jgi:feruloyl esterase
MKTYHSCFLLILFFLSGQPAFVAAQTGSHDATTCVQPDSLREKIRALKIPDVTITKVQMITAGTYTPQGTDKAFTGLPAFCLVAATLTPAPASNIRMEIWMPVNHWNGRLLGTGNGGGAGNIIYRSLAAGLKKGYATANTDMGTAPSAGAAINYLDKWADFGFRATHLMTVVSKAILLAFYNKPQQHAYFVGCSTGGQQALMEAQRYPGDYDGIIAGAPANNRTHLHTGFLWNHKVTNSMPGAAFTAAELTRLHRAVIQAFAGKDGGAPGDDFLTDPRLAKFDPATFFACRENKDSCFTPAQIAALAAIYAGPVNTRTKEQIYTAPPAGSENIEGGLGYQQTSKGADGLFYPFKWVFGVGFNYRQFDFDKDLAKLDSVLAPLLNANDPHLDPFKKRGGKLLMFTGTSDPLVPYQDALHYYERVVQEQHGLKETQSFFRYFLVPGMGHCTGGPGLNDFGQNLSMTVPQDSEHDLLLALVKWVELGTAPDKIIASATGCCGMPDTVRFQRPVYPYPLFPHYTGGDVHSPDSYRGVEHARGDVVKPAEVYLE